MRTRFLGRLVLDGTAAGLLLVALAYYWLDNTAHEWIGTAFFGLIALHNVFNRRWYGHLPRRRCEAPSLLDVVLTFALLIAMLVLLITSVVVSQTVFGFLQIDDSFTARQIHAFAAYWATVFMAIHIGIRWGRVMNAIRGALGLPADSALRMWMLRMIAGVLALYGLHSTVALEIVPKLTLQMSLEWWDFEASTTGFFVGWLSIVALFACLAHYGYAALHRHRRA
ncbi:MAG: hypothetical protein RLY78_1058 [Pseudomonadota bacterium]